MSSWPRLLVPAVAAVSLLASGCADDGTATVETGGLGPPPSIERYAVPIDALWPDSERDLIPQSTLGALGPFEVLLGSWSSSFEPIDFMVADVTDGTWADVPEPPIDGVSVRGGSVSHAGSVFLARPTCADAAKLGDRSESPIDCVGGYEGVGIWEFSGVTYTWSELAMIEPAALGISNAESFGVEVAGVSGNDLYLHAFGTLTSEESTIVRVALASGEAEMVAVTPPLTSVRCVTGAGMIVGDRLLADDPGVVSSDDIPILESQLVVHRARGPDVWEAIADVVVTDLDRVGCEANNIVVVGETDRTRSAVRWLEVDPNGRVVADTSLPSSVAARDRGINHIFVGEGTTHLGIVRGFEKVEDDHHSEVVILTGVDGTPAVVDLSRPPFEILFDAGRAANGTIYLLVFRGIDDDNPEPEFTMLVATPDGPS